MEAATDFAFKQSVFNESIHTIVGMAAAAEAVQDMISTGLDSSYFNIGATVFNAALVALQRYNRARTINFVDRQLARGDSFDPEYSNWLGVDGNAQANFRMTTSGEGTPNSLYLENTDPNQYPPEQ